jgi:hypothetical protein
MLMRLVAVSRPLICHSDKERSEEEESAIGGQCRDAVQEKQIPFGLAQGRLSRKSALK